MAHLDEDRQKMIHKGCYFHQHIKSPFLWTQGSPMGSIKRKAPNDWILKPGLDENLVPLHKSDACETTCSLPCIAK